MKRILICDDEQLIRSSLKAMLKGLGFTDIIECSDGEAAVRTAFDMLPEIAILDVSMPKKDGVTAAAEIRKKLKIPIVFLTACYDPETIDRAKKAGISAFITKPLREQDLWPAIEMACAHTDEVESLRGEVDDLKETIENRKVIEKAKGVLMKSHNLSEPDAFRRMQKLAMDKRKSLRQVAEAILLTEG